MMKKLLLTLLPAVMLVLTGCQATAEAYGEPTQNIQGNGGAKAEQITDLLPFTYVTYSEERTSVFVDKQTQTQYEIGALLPETVDFNIGSFGYGTDFFYYADPFDGILTTLGLNQQGELVQVGQQTYDGFLGLTSNDQLLVYQSQEILTCDQQLTCEKLANHYPEGVDSNGHSFSASLFGDQVYGYGATETENNQLFHLQADGTWQQFSPFPDVAANQAVNAILVQDPQNPEWLVFEVSGGYNTVTYERNEQRYTRFYHLPTGTYQDVVGPFNEYKIVPSLKDGVYVMHDNSTAISQLTVEPDNFIAAQTYSMMQISPGGVPHINKVIQITDDEIIVSTPDGVICYTISTDTSEYLIFNDVNK